MNQVCNLIDIVILSDTNTSQKTPEKLSKYNDLLAEANVPRGTTNKMHYPDLGSDA